MGLENQSQEIDFDFPAIPMQTGGTARAVPPVCSAWKLYAPGGFESGDAARVAAGACVPVRFNTGTVGAATNCGASGFPFASNCCIALTMLVTATAVGVAVACAAAVSDVLDVVAVVASAPA